MLHHVFLSLTLEMRATCHLEIRADSGQRGHTLDVALAAAAAYGAALSRSIRVDPRRRGSVASSKGTLSK
jgi:imidazoleglycerol-phosphate dehydratase